MLSQSGESARAVEHYREGLRRRPDHPEALNNLAWILATDPDANIRKGGEAVQFAKRACELTRYQRPLLLGTLAAAYAEAGHFDAAVATAREAIARARALGQSGLAEKNQQLLERYQAHQPYHEPARPSPLLPWESAIIPKQPPEDDSRYRIGNVRELSYGATGRDRSDE